MGIMVSMALMPVAMGSRTPWRSITPGASRSMGRRSVVAMGPLSSMGAPSALTTRPIMASPTGTDMMVPVRFTLVAFLEPSGEVAEQDGASDLSLHRGFSGESGDAVGEAGASSPGHGFLSRLACTRAMPSPDREMMVPTSSTWMRCW